MKKIIVSSLLIITPFAVFAQTDPNLFQNGDQTGTNYIPGSYNSFYAGNQTGTPDTGSTDAFSSGDLTGTPEAGSSNFFTGNDVTTPTAVNGTINTSSLKDFVSSIVGIITRTLIPLLLTAGVAMFIWSLAMFVLKSNDVKERQKARRYMIWSIIGLTIVFSIWGISMILRNTVFGQTGESLIPQFPEQEL